MDSVSELQSKNEELTKVNIDQNEKSRQADQALETAQQKNTELNEKLATATREFEEKIAANKKAAEEQRTSMFTLVDGLQDERDAFNETVLTLSAEKRELESLIEQQKARLSEQEQRTANTIEALTEDRDGLQAELAAATKKSASIEAELCLLYTSPSPRDATLSRMPSSA